MKLSPILLTLIFLLPLNCVATIKPVKVNAAPYSSLAKDPATQSIVGTLNGTSSVSLFGEPYYEMPLLLPEGAGGFTPQLTLISEPSLGWGDFGWNVTLSGISTIVRNDNDEYMLDGTILREYTEGEYYPEYEDLTKVVFDNYNGVVATTLDGIRTTYGASIKGEKNDASYTLMWFATKVEDKHGNYYIIEYDRSEQGTLFPTKITYSMNSFSSAVQPIEIIITKTDRGVQNIRRIGESSLKRRFRIDKIEIPGFCSYQFDYTSKNQLKSITYFAANGSDSYNPTKFEWHPESQPLNTPNNLQYNTIRRCHLFPGDFNGDGIMDYGHYIQSQRMGIIYLFKVGLRSLISAAKSKAYEHKFKPYERDANYKSFIYLNKHLGEEFSLNNGWNFISHPLKDRKQAAQEDWCVDYKDKDQLTRIRNGLDF